MLKIGESDKIESKLDELSISLQELAREIALDREERNKVVVKTTHSTKKLATPKPERLNCYLEEGITNELKTLMKLEGFNSIGDLLKFFVDNYRFLQKSKAGNPKETR